MAVIRIPASRARFDVVSPEVPRGARGVKAVPGKGKGEEAAQPAAGETIGVSDKPEHADVFLVILSYLLVGLGWWIGTMLAAKAKAVTFTPIDGIGMLALFFILAQALERLMEPLAELAIPNFGSSSNQAAANRAKNIRKAMAETDPKKKEDDADAGAGDEAQENKIKANTKVVIWAVATFVAMLISGSTKLFFLDAVGAKDVATSLNILITGLVIGSGTKPLHELIKVLEKKNESQSLEEGGGTEEGNA